MLNPLRLIAISLFLMIIVFFTILPFQVFALNETVTIVKNNSWISQRDNLNITMKLMPEVPIIDKNTIVSFELRYLNDSKTAEDLNAKVTMTDHDGRLYKFENMLIPVVSGQFSVDYIFPDDGQHRIILQLYQNSKPFTVSSFDLFIPHPAPPLQTDNLLAPLTDFFNSFLQILFR